MALKNLDQLTKKQLIELVKEVRPKADAYDRVCAELGIENNILAEFKKIKSLFNYLETLILLGFKVSFHSEGMHFYITLEKNGIVNTQTMPLEDHFYEQRIISCMEYQVKNIEEKIKGKSVKFNKLMIIWI